MQDSPLPDSITARARKLGRQYELGLLTEDEVGREFQDAVDRYVSFENRDGRSTRVDLAKRMILDRYLDLPPGAVAGLWQFVGGPTSPEEHTDLDSAAERALIQAVSAGNYWAFKNFASVAYVDRAVPDPVWEAVREVALLPHMDAFAALVSAHDHGSPEKLE